MVKNNLAHSHSERSAPPRRWLLTILFILTLLAGVVYPRLALLGHFVGMDEGSYAFISSLFALDLPQKNVYGLSLYPWLLSWIYNLPGMPMIWFRLLDLLCALFAAFFFCRILQKECRSQFMGLFIGLLFLCPMNGDEVIEAGFKNSIPISLLFFFMAVYFSRSGRAGASPPWYLVGALTALGVLMRESFALYSLLGFFSIWAGWNFASALKYAFGGIALALVVLAIVHLWFMDSGGLPIFVEGYVERAKLYANESSRILTNFVQRGLLALETFAGMLLFFVFSIISLLFYRLRRPDRKRFLFWAMTSIAALVEPITKLGFVYHFAVGFPGIACMTAIAFDSIKAARPGRRYIAAALFVGAAALALAINTLPSPSAFASTAKILRNFPNRTWPPEMVTTSMPLKVVDEILSQDGKSLAASGFSFYLYYLSGLLPPAKGEFDAADPYRLSDLSRAFLLMARDIERMSAYLGRIKPDIVAIGIASTVHEKDYNRELEKALELTGLYELAKEFPPDLNLDYGWMGYKIYRLKKKSG